MITSFSSMSSIILHVPPIDRLNCDDYLCPTFYDIQQYFSGDTFCQIEIIVLITILLFSHLQNVFLATVSMMGFLRSLLQYLYQEKSSIATSLLSIWFDWLL